MLSYFKNRVQNVNGYGDAPFSFLEPGAQQVIGDILSIDLIENGARAAREDWQKKQLSNLIKHAHRRSKYWRQRIGGPQNIMPERLPILTRKDVVGQVNDEGALSIDKEQAIATYRTTGSTGTPLQVFVCQGAIYYNNVRSIAQMFFDNLSLDENRVHIDTVKRLEDLNRTPVVSSSPHWAGPLSSIYRNGSNKSIGFNKDIDGLIKELSKDSVGYLVCRSRILEEILAHGGPKLVESLGVKAWIHLSDYRSREAVKQLKAIGIRSLSSYSSGEMGPIAFECTVHEGYYHVAHTNVIVESDDLIATTVDGETVTRLLITHLHSYATPLIRYDVGDFGKLHDQCLCGHDGPTISHIHGRGKHFLRHPNGKYLPFQIPTRMLLAAVNCKEIRFRQDAVDTITVYLGGRASLTADEEEKLRTIVTEATDPAFKILIRPVEKIDWSDNPKQLFFSSSVV